MSTVDRKMVFRNLKETLTEEIKGQRALPGTPVLSTKQISEKYKVSFITANKAINALVDDGLLYRVHGSGTFIAETNDKGKKKSYNIGIVAAVDLHRDTGTEIAFGTFLNPAAEYLSSVNCNIKYFSYQNLQNVEKFAELDGLIVSHSCVDGGTLKIFEKLAKPLVTLQHEYTSEISYNQVIPDLISGCRKAAEHLYSAGHREIYIASLCNSNHSRNRIEAFTKAAENAGFDKNSIYPVLFDVIIGDNGRLAGQKIAEKILKERKCNAIFSTSDFISFGILDRIYEKGLKPGRDIAVASYDDLESDGLCPFGNPILTSVHNPRKEISIRAAALLYEIVERNEKCLHIIKVPTELVIRESSQIQ